jgi:hypothetical protein
VELAPSVDTDDLHVLGDDGADVSGLVADELDGLASPGLDDALLVGGRVRWISATLATGSPSRPGSSGGRGLWSSWVTLTAPCRFAVPRQSAAVSPPPTMTTRLPAASIGGVDRSPVRTRLASGK